MPSDDYNGSAGHFTIKDSVLTGPEDYMLERGNKLVDAIFDGTDTIYNMTAHLSPGVATAVCVRLQTDYAGWLGERQILSMMEDKNV